MTEQRIVNIADLPMKTRKRGDRIAASTGRAGPIIGSSDIGCSLVVVAPGKAAVPFHRHHVRAELFFILEGEGATRLDDETLPIRAGDLIAAPAGKEAHQIVNTGTRDLRYLAISAENPVDIIEYPDSGKLAAGAGFASLGLSTPTIDVIGRLTPTDYYDGEESS